MTNSIATAKCPTSVLSSGNYGISQNRCADETKEYIFVKLTDSALRAIEEYQRNDNAKRFKGTEQSAKIQFSGNNGFIHFPLPDSQEGREFGFAIDDIEGSLECIHQNHQELNVLGALSYRMRIHANDDVYDTTRTKMAIAEETEKSKCIREIKPNQTDIGRKVKKAVSAASVAATINQNYNNHNHHNNNNHHLSTINTLGSQSHNHNNNNNSSSNSYLSSRNKLPISAAGTAAAASSLSSSPPPPNAASRSPNILHSTSASASALTFVNSNYSSAVSTLSSQLASGISNGYAEMKTSNKNLGNNNKGSTKIANTGNNMGIGQKTSGGGGNKQLPDISRRKIRERLIHLLALKPFKKPELYTRLQNEGLRDRERPLISNILKDISSLSRDNTFNLKRQMWNDVNENWPYYTEQEIQQLKRRKPQNLTPPLSSDAGSSTSGHSPTSIHTGSPPPLVGGANSMGKRTAAEAAGGLIGYGDDNFFSGVQPKKQRISHFKKDPGPGITAAANQRGTQRQTGIGTADYLVGNRHNNNNNNKQHMKSPNTFMGQQETTKTTSDLSFNILDNVDELMPHMQEQTNSNFFSAIPATTTTSSTVSGGQQRKNTNLKDKQNNNNNINKRQNNYTNNTAAISPKPYGGSSFVPESGKKSNNSSSQSKKQQQQTTKPTNANSKLQQQQQQQYISPNKIDDNNIMMRSQSISNMNNYKIPKNRYPQQQQQQQQQQQKSQTNIKNVRQKQQQQQELTITTSYQQQQQQQHREPQLSTPPQQQQQPQSHNYSSPTQQIAAAASNYATTALNDSTTPRQKYDFSQYTAITSIEQRRKYKTEFESDYDEYLKLLAQIESVGKRFRALADQLESARKGCADYYEIKQKIVMEYERIRNEESLTRDKQRFDYLHEKLAHIKQLVTDYDKTLTDAAAAAAEQLRQQQQQQQQQQEHLRQQQQLQIQQQQQQRLSPMIMSEGESNPSPPMSYHSAMLMQQQQQPQKYHAAETIPYQKQQQHQLQQQQLQQPSYKSSGSSQISRNSPNFNANYVMLKQQQEEQQQRQQQLAQQQHINIQKTKEQQQAIKSEPNDNSDSDSSSSSDDYDDDDDDDDQSQDDDDENSNSNDSD